ncbi:ABC transporter ATP-binding protein [Solirubrobacter sp. CPCC 204708]|uniref:ABC transporter ATP-binding protein/permease n=1 Tax=Solirubrobacter deserti TaxID=2282478 RepID=A0ABT4RIA8_9ACTN|nr:ABC transporter ATP-binding protein [Solirubrobacter deserti]MBE2318898.1 ABC transporter ATP-binding protein [Solirubrobacter deserti]MDA0138279.1 ABC transporter ATP-binding protein/permease [Solirubrobacter deserti]
MKERRVKSLPVATSKQCWAVIRELLRPRRTQAIVATVVLVAAAAVGLLGPLLLGEIVDRVDSRTGSITWPAVALLGAALGEALLAALGLTLISYLGQPILASLRERVVAKALRLPAAQIERGGRGDLLSRLGDDIAVVSEAVVEAFPPLAAASLTLLLSFAGLATIDPRLTLAALLVVPVQVWAVRWYAKRAGPAYAEERKVSGERAQAILDVVGGAKTIRALNLAGTALPRVEARSVSSIAAVVRTIRISTHFSSRLNAAEFVGTASVLVVGFFLVDADAITVGAATAGALLFIRNFDTFNIVLGTIDEANRALAALARLVGVLQVPDPPSPEPHDGAHVSLTNISHAYDGGPPVLHDIDLQIAAGERVAIVGVSGSGKTTLAKVVARFHEPTSGTAHVGDVALVTQEVHVFAGTLADDLRLADPTASDEALRAALQAVKADWASLDTVVGHGGVELTPAQAQQLALARLHIRDPQIAVLDEATAEAGSAGARLLEQAAASVLDGRTALVVAHRLTQAARADRIVVMDQGRIVESGTHKELVAAGGTYAALWRAWSAER